MEEMGEVREVETGLVVVKTVVLKVAALCKLRRHSSPAAGQAFLPKAAVGPHPAPVRYVGTPPAWSGTHVSYAGRLGRVGARQTSPSARRVYPAAHHTSPQVRRELGDIASARDCLSHRGQAWADQAMAVARRARRAETPLATLRVAAPRGTRFVTLAMLKPARLEMGGAETIAEAFGSTSGPLRRAVLRPRRESSTRQCQRCLRTGRWTAARLRAHNESLDTLNARRRRPCTRQPTL